MEWKKCLCVSQKVRVKNLPSVDYVVNARPNAADWGSAVVCLHSAGCAVRQLFISVCNVKYHSKAPSTPATCRSNMSNVAVRHVAVFGNMSNDFFILSTCRNKFEHVQFLSTCRTNEQQVAVEEAGVVLPDISRSQQDARQLRSPVYSVCPGT